MLGDHLAALGEALVAKNLSQKKRREMTAGRYLCMLERLLIVGLHPDLRVAAFAFQFPYFFQKLQRLNCSQRAESLPKLFRFQSVIGHQIKQIVIAADK